MVSAPARRELVRYMVEKGLSERRSLAVMGMSASALRYEPRPDRNVELRERILALAHRHRRYGVGMIHLKLRQEGRLVNYKRVERLYQEARLQVRRRKRKKILFGERQPLLRPTSANQVWSMDFVFDRTAEGRVLKCLTIVDDATHEAVAIEVERAISGIGVSRVLDRMAKSRGLPQIIRSDNGKEFCGKDMVKWAYERGVLLRLIEPGKPNGARQASCRLSHAAKACLFVPSKCAAMTASRSGLRVTAPMGDQSRVVPDQRAGLRALASVYSTCRAARMAMSSPAWRAAGLT